MKRTTTFPGRSTGANAVLGLLLCVGSLCLGPTTAYADPPPDSRAFDVEWAKRREIREIHKKLFLKDGRGEFAIFGGVIPNDEFNTYFPIGLKIDYYFLEDVSGEIAFGYFVQRKGKLKPTLEEGLQPPISGIQVLVPQTLEYMLSFGALWVPFKGKIGTGSALMHFDLGLAFGAMTFGTKVEKEGSSDVARRTFKDWGGYVGATVRLFLNSFMALRLDYRHYLYPGRDADDNVRGVSFPLELSLGLSFFTPERK